MSEKEKLDSTEDEFEIIDFQSDDRSDSVSQVNRPVPGGIKWILGGVSVALLVGMGSLYAFKGNTHSPANEVDVMQIGGDSDESVGTDELIARLNADQFSEQAPQKTGLTLGPVTGQDEMNAKIMSIEAQIQKMTQQMDDLAHQGTIIKTMNTRMGEMANHFETLPTQDDLTDMRQDFNERLQKSNDALKKSLVKNHKKAKPYVSKKKTSPSRKIPFQLVSIDQWNGVDYAAIQSKNIGAIENLRSGDTRSGWKVERIDSGESSVVFKHVKTGRSIKQTAI